MRQPSLSLAEHFQAAADRHPQAEAVTAGNRRWTWRRWLDELASGLGTPAPNATPWRTHGSALDLARAAFTCSLQNRPFWPVDCVSTTQPAPLPPPGTVLLISTAGSEGHPKTVCLSQPQLDHAACQSNRRLDLRAGDCWLHCLPLYHIGGQAILWRCARAAASLCLHDGFSVAALAADLAHKEITHLSLVPTMLARLIEADVRPPAGLRVALIGGAALSQTLYDRAVAAGWPLIPSYGMSESAAMIAAWQPSDGPWRAGQVGQLLPGSQASLTVDGRLRLHGQQLMLAYLDGSGRDADGGYTTGDRGEIAANGQLTVLGRADDMLISGGINVHPQQIEGCLAALPGVNDVAVDGRPDEEWGQRVVALIVGPVDLAQVRAHVARHLPAAAWPREVHRVSNLPRNAAGKLDRLAVRQWIARLRP